MQIDPTSPEGQAYIADHLGATYDADDYAAFLESDLHACDECGELFTVKQDTDYGENNDRLCRTCCIEGNEDRFFAVAA